jgi:hypothetical protein
LAKRPNNHLYHQKELLERERDDNCAHTNSLFKVTPRKINKNRFK